MTKDIQLMTCDDVYIIIHFLYADAIYSAQSAQARLDSDTLDLSH